MPGQKADLLETYSKTLDAMGKAGIAKKLTPGIRFVTSDTGISAAKVSALLVGGQYPIHIGSCVSIDHRHQAKVKEFGEALEQLFAQFGGAVEWLQNPACGFCRGRGFHHFIAFSDFEIY